MAQVIISPMWKSEILQKIRGGYALDEVLQHNLPAKWLIAELTTRNIPFKVISLPAGVKRIMTGPGVDRCPCCLKKY